jgi:hypothetical protein
MTGARRSDQSLVMQQEDPAPVPERENVWRDYGTRARIVFALIGLCGLTPLFLLMFEEDKTPLWQQWVAVAVFTPITLIIEWIAVTGRTTLGNRSRTRGSGGHPPAA